MNMCGFFALSTVMVLGTVRETSLATAQEKTEERAQFRCRDESKKRFDVEAVRIGGDIGPPKKLVDVQPEFPDFPAGTTYAGIWIGEILVNTDGLVVDAWTHREPTFEPPFPEFTQGVLKAITKWEYEPVSVEGERVPFCMTVTVNFHVM